MNQYLKAKELPMTKWLFEMKINKFYLDAQDSINLDTWNKTIFIYLDVRSTFNNSINTTNSAINKS